ncbi:hypothetical protein [Thermofilum sp.]|jgi:hypothetical protein|uniref:hypothetical protein n=1 Tax=Thermofilum sp. TaxID=1961369 RepID=UPI00258FC222|nr:hypothetical protein [Thermofilum sp.]
MPEQIDVKSYVKTLPELIEMTKELGRYTSHRPGHDIKAFMIYSELRDLEEALELCDYTITNRIFFDLGYFHGKWTQAVLSSDDEELEIVEDKLDEFREKIYELEHEIDHYFKNVCGIKVRNL